MKLTPDISLAASKLGWGRITLSRARRDSARRRGPHCLGYTRTARSTASPALAHPPLRRPNAVFLFVAASEVAAVAERFNAVPFDIEGVFWSHRGDYLHLRHHAGRVWA